MNGILEMHERGSAQDQFQHCGAIPSELESQFWLGAAESLREQPALNWVPRAPEIAEVSEPFDRMRVALVWQGMERKMNILSKAVVVAAGALALAANAASAAIVCNDEGDCWHAKRSDFKPEFKLHIHPDNWKWGTSEHFKWREHEGHGYWRGGKWVDIR